MKKAMRILMVIATLGLILSWGLIGLAQDKPDRPDRPDRPERPDKPQQGGKQRQGMGPMVMSPQIKEEMQRHREVMKGLFEQIKALHKKVKSAIGSKMKEMRKELKDKRDRPERPAKADRTDKPERPDRPDRPEGFSEGKPREKFREDIEKLLEPYRAEAEQIAGAIVTEMALHHQNLAQIISSDQADITQRLAKKILMPRRQGQRRRGGQGKGDRPERPNRPDRPDRPEHPRD